MRLVTFKGLPKTLALKFNLNHIPFTMKHARNIFWTASPARIPWPAVWRAWRENS